MNKEQYLIDELILIRKLWSSFPKFAPDLAKQMLLNPQSVSKQMPKINGVTEILTIHDVLLQLIVELLVIIMEQKRQPINEIYGIPNQMPLCTCIGRLLLALNHFEITNSNNIIGEHKCDEHGNKIIFKDNIVEEIIVDSHTCKRTNEKMTYFLNK